MSHRCGAVGVIVVTDAGIAVEVEEVISESDHGGLHLRFPVDMSVGQRVAVGVLAGEHRGIVILDDGGITVDEGELWADAAGDIRFMSDHDDGLPPTSVRHLAGRRVEIKWEMRDEIGARRRLRQVQDLFR